MWDERYIKVIVMRELVDILADPDSFIEYRHDTGEPDLHMTIRMLAVEIRERADNLQEEINAEFKGRKGIGNE